jgi:hypothetical protein
MVMQTGRKIEPAHVRFAKNIDHPHATAACSLLTRTLGRETRLKKTSNTRLTGFHHIFILQLHEAIRRSVLEPKAGVRNPYEITSFDPKRDCRPPCGAFEFICSSAN